MACLVKVCGESRDHIEPNGTDLQSGTTSTVRKFDSNLRIGTHENTGFDEEDDLPCALKLQTRMQHLNGPMNPTGGNAGPDPPRQHLTARLARTSRGLFMATQRFDADLNRRGATGVRGETEEVWIGRGVLGGRRGRECTHRSIVRRNAMLEATWDMKVQMFVVLEARGARGVHIESKAARRMVCVRKRLAVWRELFSSSGRRS